MTLEFRPSLFDPAQAPGASVDTLGCVIVPGQGGNAYLYSPEITLAINLALATRRPLLLAGSPGTGKTTLAANVAHVLGWRYLQRVVNSRTRARDLMWSFDTVRRLSDAQASAQAGPGTLRPLAAYVEPQLLWWAFDRDAAARRGVAPGQVGVTLAQDPCPATADGRAVVLLDEIDKAEPDLPNDLLEALDTVSFSVDDVDPPVRVSGDRGSVLTFITTNGERELPAAFLRRCVVLKLQPPTADWLVHLANHRHGAAGEPLHRAIAQRIVALREAADRQGHRRQPSTAEYLDALEACRRLGIGIESPEWQLLEQAVLWKRDELRPGAAVA